MSTTEITTKDREEFFAFWLKQRRAIEGRVSEETMQWFNAYTDKDNVGYGFAQLRPGKLGQWDLYWNLTGEQSVGCDENEAMIASGLTATEVAEEKRREYYRARFVDPDSPLEIAEFERINAMKPTELNSEIARLEALLGYDPLPA